MQIILYTYGFNRWLTTKTPENELHWLICLQHSFVYNIIILPCLCICMHQSTAVAASSQYVEWDQRTFLTLYCIPYLVMPVIRSCSGEKRCAFYLNSFCVDYIAFFSFMLYLVALKLCTIDTYGFDSFLHFILFLILDSPFSNNNNCSA